MNPQQLKAMGRGGDNTVAHLTPGEVVLPHEVAQKLKSKIESMIGQDQMARLTVGRGTASINPATGLEEFGFFSKVFKKVRRGFGYFTGQTQTQKAQATLNRDMRAAEKRMQEQFKQQADEMEALFQQHLAKQAEAQDKQNAETDLLLQGQKIEALKTRRKFTGEQRSKILGATYGASEAIGAANPLEAGGPQYTPRRSRRRASFGGRAMPTLQIGGQFRPR